MFLIFDAMKPPELPYASLTFLRLSSLLKTANKLRRSCVVLMIHSAPQIVAQLIAITKPPIINPCFTACFGSLLKLEWTIGVQYDAESYAAHTLITILHGQAIYEVPPPPQRPVFEVMRGRTRDRTMPQLD